MPMNEADATIWELRFRAYPVKDLIQWAKKRDPEYDTGSIARVELTRRLRADGVPELGDDEAWDRFAPIVPGS